MTKKDISKILASGSARQKYLLIAEDVARARLSLSRILTDTEFNALVDSIKTPQEIKVYNKLRNADKAISHSMMTLIYFEALYQNTISNLDKFTLLWESYQNAEELANFILLEIKDPKERREIAKRAAAKRSNSIVFHALEVDADGYIKVDYSDLKSHKIKFSIKEALETLSKRALHDLIEVKSLAQAMLDFMEERGLNVKTQKDMINKTVTDAMSRKAALPKYSPVWGDGKNKRGSMPWQELLPQYVVYPDPETPPDPKRVEYFRKEVLEANE